MKKFYKIKLVEEPQSEEVLQRELEEALGGWNCGTYSNGWFRDKCKGFDSGICTKNINGNNYCDIYNTHI